MSVNNTGLLQLAKIKMIYGQNNEQTKKNGDKFERC